MPHVVTIKSLPQAFDVIKEMDDQGYDWGEGYRRAGRAVAVDFFSRGACTRRWTVILRLWPKGTKRTGATVPTAVSF